MRQLDTDLWIADSPLRFLGLEVGTRMTVVRLSDNKLLLHSPVAPTPDLLRDVKAVGRVAYLVAPNQLHHLFIGEWQKAFPDAEVYVAPGLDTKRADLAITGVLTDEPESGWEDVIDQVLVDGFPFANEVMFFHRPSATLIATDLMFNVGPSSPPLTRLVIRLIGAYGRLSPTLLERLLIRDRSAFRHSLERILEWPFARVVVAHGEVSEKGGREEIVRGYSWLLGQENA
jgi:hypothetical protein